MRARWGCRGGVCFGWWSKNGAGEYLTLRPSRRLAAKSGHRRGERCGPSGPRGPPIPKAMRFRSGVQCMGRAPLGPAGPRITSCDYVAAGCHPHKGCDARAR
jgi:hypothetical protein